MTIGPNEPEVRSEVERRDETIDEMRARLAALEAELSRKNQQLTELRRERRAEQRAERRDRREARDTVRDVAEQTTDQTRQIFRGLVDAQLEQLRLSADLVSSFADDVQRRNRPEDSRSERDLPRDMLDSVLDTIDRSLEIPEKAVDTFHDSYKRAKRSDR